MNLSKTDTKNDGITTLKMGQELLSELRFRIFCANKKILGSPKCCCLTERLNSIFETIAVVAILFVISLFFVEIFLLKIEQLSFSHFDRPIRFKCFGGKPQHSQQKFSLMSEFQES